MCYCIVECATDQFSVVPEDLKLGEIEKVDNAVFPMDQYENVLIPHIDFVIPEKFDVVDCKYLLFFVPTKVILDLKQVLLVSILILTL